jgi:hypothetical protein
LKGAEKENHLGEGGEGYYNKIIKNFNQHTHLIMAAAKTECNT